MLSILRRKKKIEPPEQKPISFESRDISDKEVELKVIVNPDAKCSDVKRRSKPEVPDVDMSKYQDLSSDLQDQIRELMLKSIYHEHPELDPLWAGMDDEFIKERRSLTCADLNKLNVAKLMYSETGDIERCIRDVEAIWNQERGCGLCSRDRYYLVDLYVEADRIDDALDLLDVIAEEYPRDTNRVARRKEEIKRNAGLIV